MCECVRVPLLRGFIVVCFVCECLRQNFVISLLYAFVMCSPFAIVLECNPHKFTGAEDRHGSRAVHCNGSAGEDADGAQNNNGNKDRNCKQACGDHANYGAHGQQGC